MIEYGAVFCIFSHSTNRLAGGVPFAVRNNPPSYLRKRVGDYLCTSSIMIAHITLDHCLRVWTLVVPRPYNEAMCHQNMLEIEGENQRTVKLRSAFLGVRLQNRNMITACL